MRYVVLVSVVFLVFVSLAGALRACTTSDMLDLIGSLEAPQGYDQVYGGVTLAPPRPITSMTVAEVLSWQREASRTAPSSAAGRYQVIRSTLQGLVDLGVVSPTERFSSSTQDRIGRYLLQDTGYRDGDSSPSTLNRIAGVWAALPKVSGPGAGASAYQGIAGNHALIDMESYQKFAACGLDLDTVSQISTAIRTGLRFGFNFDKLIEALEEHAEGAIAALGASAQALILMLFAADLVWRGGKTIIGEGSLEDYVAETFFRILVVTFFLFVMMNASAISREIAEVATGIAEDASDHQGFSLGTWASNRFAMMFKHVRESSTLSWWMAGATLMAGLVSVLCMAFIMGRITLTYAHLVVTTASSLITMAFAGLSVANRTGADSARRLVGISLEILGMNLILVIMLDLTSDLSAQADAFWAALAVLIVDMMTVGLVMTIPGTLATLARRSG